MLWIVAGAAALAVLGALVWYLAVLLRRALSLASFYEPGWAWTFLLMIVAAAIVIGVVATRSALAIFLFYVILAALAVDAVVLLARRVLRGLRGPRDAGNAAFVAAAGRAGAPAGMATAGQDAFAGGAGAPVAAPSGAPAGFARGWPGVVYRSCMIPLVVAALATGYGMHNMGQVQRTDYTIASDKLSRGYTVVLVADTHYTTIQDRDALSEALSEIRAAKPDLLILGGDIVDESTPPERVEEVFSRLASIEPPLGTYYVWGNHDRATYSRSSGFDEAAVEAAIMKAGITMLVDDRAEVNGDLTLVGREDRGMGRTPRASIEKLLRGADPASFTIVADHQPAGGGPEEAARAGADLQVSGHTHAMQIFPAGQIARLLGAYVYGRYEVDGMPLVVTSGFAGWGLPVRTEEHCEYVVIHLSPAA